MLSAEGKEKVERMFTVNCQGAEFFHFKSIMGYYPPELGCVYAFEMSDNTVKIGVTRKIEKRVKGVEHAVYLNVLRVHHTILAPLEFMRIIEARCHATFADRRVRGEYFDITFEEAVAELDSYAEEIAAEFAEADQNFLDEFLYYEELKKNYFNPKPSIVSEPAHVVKRKYHAIFPGYACVYVLLMSDGTVKIGFSGNIRARVAKIKRDSKLTVNDLYISPFIPREVARLIEWACQEKFSSQRVEGEFFSITFDNACKAVNTFVSAVNILSSALKHYIATEKLLADKNSV